MSQQRQIERLSHLAIVGGLAVLAAALWVSPVDGAERGRGRDSGDPIAEATTTAPASVSSSTPATTTAPGTAKVEKRKKDDRALAERATTTRTFFERFFGVSREPRWGATSTSATSTAATSTVAGAVPAAGSLGGAVEAVGLRASAAVVDALGRFFPSDAYSISPRERLARWALSSFALLAAATGAALVSGKATVAGSALGASVAPGFLRRWVG
jgi:hypothetical protein